MTESKYLPLHVPEWLYEDALRYVSMRMEERSGKLEPPERASPAIMPSGDLKTPEWTIEDFQRLFPLLFPRNKVALALLDLAAENPGKLVTYEAACKHAGLSPNQGRAHIGAMTKSCKKIGHLDDWPVAPAWGEGGVEKQYYRMSKNTSDAWKQVRDEMERKDED